MSFKKVAVIGAGTMGAGIAGQVANAGVDVLLLDLPSDGEDVNALARKGLERISDPSNPGLMSDAAKARVQIGNIRDDFDKLAECDWVAEAILERLDLKRDLYKRLDSVCHDDTIISSNTSTIPISLLVEEMPPAFRARFAITHFFNPVRFMPLLELVRGEDTSPEVMRTLHAFCDEQLGKGVVPCLDTPGFLGNRVGVYAIQCALHTAFNMGLTPQEADAVFGRPMGIPKTGVFGLYDLIGIDLMSDVAQSLVNILPASDPFHAQSAKIPLMLEMIADGRRGQKSGQGFYKGRGPAREVTNLETGEYAPAAQLSIPEADRAEKDGVRHILDAEGRYGEYAWQVLSNTLTYAAMLVPEVHDTGVTIDDAMRMGYNWIQGPFELIDEIGVDYFIDRLEREQRSVPEFLKQAAGSSFYRVEGGTLQARQFGGTWTDITRPEGTQNFSERRKTLTAQARNTSASWYDLDGVALVEFHSKANALDAQSMQILDAALDAVGSSDHLRGLIVHNDAQHFSCGVNLNAVRGFFEAEDMDGLDAFLAHFQQTVHKMAVADFPVVCAPVGLSLGGGFEVVLHSKQVICHANSNMGLVETGVGVIPGGGGCKETLYRWVAKLGLSDDISAASWEAFKSLGYAKTASSPVRARDLAMLRANDRYENNRDRLLSEALKAIDDPSGQVPFSRPALPMPGRPVFEEIKSWLAEKQAAGTFLPHDVFISTEVARIVTGGDIEPGTLWSEQDLYDAERRAFLTLVSTEATRARVTSLLDQGGAVRN